jgi:hypothetical protein
MGVITAASLADVAYSTRSANTRISGTESDFERDYPRIREIVIEEAKNNGFPQLASEITPTKANEWKGGLFFTLRTGAGTDNFAVDFYKSGDRVVTYLHGAGTRTQPGGAAKAIVERLNKPLQ